MTIKAGAGCSMHSARTRIFVSNNLLLNFAIGFDFYKKNLLLSNAEKLPLLAWRTKAIRRLWHFDSIPSDPKY